MADDELPETTPEPVPAATPEPDAAQASAAVDAPEVPEAEPIEPSAEATAPTADDGPAEVDSEAEPDTRSEAELEPGAQPEPEPEPDVEAGARPARRRPATRPAPASEHAPGIARTVTVISLRVVRGLAGLAVAAAVVAAVGLVPLPTVGVEPLATMVEPEPADLLALCPGSLLRLGDDTGANAGQAFAVGEPDLTVASSGSPSRTPLTGSDAGSGGTSQAPTLLRLAPSDDAALGAAQVQSVAGDGGLQGLAASGCAEPASSAWLVGGATTVGRTTLLLIANPSEVEAEVSIELWGESGVVAAPGMKGIAVPAGGQRVLPLSGFAPDLASPVVHVEARGGQVVTALQTSVTRVLDAGGVDLVSAGAAPTREVVIPAVRIADAEGIASSLGLEGYEDLEAVVRIGNPGEATASVEVSVTPTAEGGTATSFEIDVPPGQVSDTALSAALALGADPFVDGSYTVTLRSDAPVVAAVRASTIPPPTTDADGEITPGPTDVAWFASASGLTDDVAVAVADAPNPVLVAVSADGSAHTLTLTPVRGGTELTVAVPDIGSVAVELAGGTGYLLSGTRGVALALSFADAGELAGYPLVSPRAADSPLVIRP